MNNIIEGEYESITISLLLDRFKCLRDAFNDMTHMIQKGINRCDYCIARDMSCPLKGLNIECPFEYCNYEQTETSNRKREKIMRIEENVLK